MATSTTPALEMIKSSQCVALYDVDWKGYRSLLRLRGPRGRPRLLYLDGTAWLLSPSFHHERLATRLGLLVMTIAEELEVPCTPTASTTFRRKGKRGGVEGDQTYYLANEPAIRGKDRIDLKVDPPPDLAIEAVYSHDASPAIEIYRRLGVPEVWVCEASEVRILLLDVDRQYTESTTSGAFPVIQATDILDWISRPSDTPETQWLKAVRQWVKGTVFPRFRELSNKADTS